ncbi:unnamed protein product [Haemonchus placei]|uniref:DUF676 domain-containing protein n=1 Tax=Haemonchus placei TaxID=6290 RepID=A0A0N4X9S9_HAEPC|nr:unnamed protein product [Haemonchus placei]
MDRHRPPNLSLFELESKRTIEISLCPERLTAGSRTLFFEHSAYAALTITAYASLVSVLPRRKKQPPDPFPTMYTSDTCDVATEMESLKSRLDTAVNPWNEVENMAIFALVSKSKYLEKLPRYPIFCRGLDTSPDNWCLIVEERLPTNRPSTSGGSEILTEKLIADPDSSLQSELNRPESSSISGNDLSSAVDFVMERERLKATLLEQKLFDGYLYRNIFRVVADNVPGFCYLLSASNHSKTWSNFDDMADNLLSEVHSYASRYSELPARISFVAHSLGGVIVRTAVTRKDASDWLVPRLHCLLTINTPHLGLAYVGRGINLGIQLMQWWKQSRSMEQLALKDEVSFSDSFLYRLSKKRTFGLFRYVLLIGTPGKLILMC